MIQEMFLVGHSHGILSPSTVAKSLNEFVLIWEVFLNFLSHVKDGTISTEIRQIRQTFVNWNYMSFWYTESNRDQTNPWSLIMMYTMVKSKSAIPVPNYLKEKTCVTHSLHAKCFINLGSSSNTYKYSFSTRTVKEWSSLPSQLTNNLSPHSNLPWLLTWTNEHTLFLCYFKFALVTAPNWFN